MHKFESTIKNILNKNRPDISCSSFELNSFYNDLNENDRFVFIDNIWFVFRNAVHNISRDCNNLYIIKSILNFHENSEFKDCLLDSNNVICFSFPLRHQVYNDDCHFSESLIEMYALFFDDKGVFFNKNREILGMAISEIKGFIKYSLKKHIKEVNKLFSNKIVFNYFYQNQKEWLKENSLNSKLSIIKNKLIIEEF